jgi:glycerophosphoryl diester phosphodiesterase
VEKWGVKKIPVGERTVAELKQLDAGKWYGEPFAGTTIPTLAEALDCIQDGGVTLIERKQGQAADCVRLLRERGEINRVIVQAFDWKFLAEFHALEPKQILGALGPPATKEGRKLTDAEKSLNAAYAAEAKAAGARVIGWNSLVSREGVTAAHAAGLEVWIYTINSADEAKALVAAGVDGIITDNPPLIRRAVAAPAAR